MGTDQQVAPPPGFELEDASAPPQGFELETTSTPKPAAPPPTDPFQDFLNHPLAQGILRNYGNLMVGEEARRQAAATQQAKQAPQMLADFLNPKTPAPLINPNG